jgi:glycosyltransferase involved in cell wall biosynthesis
MITHDYEVEVNYKKTMQTSECTVIVPLYNYEDYIKEALDSVYLQDCENLSLIVINDKSTDKSLEVAKNWFAEKSNRFTEATLMSHIKNQGLSVSRNTAIYAAKTPYLFFLDADNILYPKCITTHVNALKINPEAYFSYSIIEVFGESSDLIGTKSFQKENFLNDNYIDAMACIRRDILLKMNGYTIMPGKHGWEDYELWLRICDEGGFGMHIPQILSRYRVHNSSMKATDTDLIDNANKLINYLNQKFSWMNKPLHKPTKQ